MLEDEDNTVVFSSPRALANAHDAVSADQDKWGIQQLVLRTRRRTVQTYDADTPSPMRCE